MQELSNKVKVTLPLRRQELPRDAADGGQRTKAPLCEKLKAINAAIAAHIATVDANNVVGGTAGQAKTTTAENFLNARLRWKVWRLTLRRSRRSWWSLVTRL